MRSTRILIGWPAPSRGRGSALCAAHQTKPINLFLYDVTRSYLEGTHNELAAFGYNRDGKKGKRQIVRLTRRRGRQSVPIEVFPGNTQDPQTFARQINKVKTRFGVQAITLVGDG